MTTQIKLNNDLLSRIEYAMEFYTQCRPREGFSIEERNTIRALRDISNEVVELCESSDKSMKMACDSATDRPLDFSSSIAAMNKARTENTKMYVAIERLAKLLPIKI